MLHKWQTLGSTQYHENIKFIGNKIKGFNQRAVFARSVKGLVIEENIIELSKTYPTEDNNLGITLEYCRDVIIKNNEWKGFNTPSEILIDNISKNIITKNNKGTK